VDPATPVFTSAGSYYSPSLGGFWAADTSGLWALGVGVHDISSLMPLSLRTNADGSACGAACYFKYQVWNTDCLGLGALNTDYTSCKTVVFDMKYAD
jgi:hypothetical protein